MFYEKYKPIYLNDYQFHLNLIPKLKKLCEKDISNILLYGDKNIGKMTLVKCLINTYYKQNIKEKNNIVKINGKELTFKSSNYYFEIILDNYYNKKKFEELINYICENNEINNKCNFKLIIIKNIEYIDEESVKLIKYIIEKKYNSIRFILITSNFSKINNFIKGFFLLFRVPSPCKEELLKYLKKLFPKIQKSKITTVLNETYKLTEIFMKLEINNLNNYVDPYINNSNKLIKLIETKKSSNILKIRELLYSLMSKNYNLNYIYKNIFNILITKNYDNKTKLNIIKIYSEYNSNITFKNIIHIESLLINVMNIIK
jgi:DNA polymerase III delta prime subunit